MVGLCAFFGIGCNSKRPKRKENVSQYEWRYNLEKRTAVRIHWNKVCAVSLHISLLCKSPVAAQHDSIAVSSGVHTAVCAAKVDPLRTHFNGKYRCESPFRGRTLSLFMWIVMEQNQAEASGPGPPLSDTWPLHECRHPRWHRLILCYHIHWPISCLSLYLYYFSMTTLNKNNSGIKAWFSTDSC